MQHIRSVSWIFYIFLTESPYLNQSFILHLYKEKNQKEKFYLQVLRDFSSDDYKYIQKENIYELDIKITIMEVCNFICQLS